MSKPKKNVQRKPVQQTTAAVPWIYDKNIHYLSLFAGAFIIYGWTIGFGYNMDDDYILYQLKDIERGTPGIIQVFQQWYASADYRPVTMLSFWLERAIFGEIRAGNAHFINVVLFGVLLTQLYRFIRACRFYENDRYLSSLALLAALFFLVHTNHVSVVANIKSRDNILSMIFGMLCAMQFIFLYDRKQYWRLIPYILFGVLALLSKQDSYSLILSPLLVIILFRDVSLKIITRLFIGIGFLFIMIFTIKNKLAWENLDTDFQTFVPHFTENPLIGNSSFRDKISFTLTTLWYYIKFLLLPWGYYFYFGYDQIPLQSLYHPQNFLAMAIALVSAAAAFYFYRYKRDKLYIFCFIFFGLAIYYALNLYLPVSGIVMDRYNFIPSLAFCLALAGLILYFFPEEKFLIHRNTTIAVLLLFYTGFTFYRTGAWRDSFTLFDRDLPFLERSLHANRIAAGTYIHLALEEEQKPGFNKALADSFILKGEKYALRALQVSDQNAKVWEHIGLCALYRKEYNIALQNFKNGLRVDTTYLSNINYVGVAYWNLNRPDSAEYFFNYVIQRENYFGFSANNLVNLYVQYGYRNKADSLLRDLYSRYPDDKRLINKTAAFNSNP